MTQIVNLLKGFFTPDVFMKALPILGKGMLGIFVVTGVIVLSILALNRLTAEKK